MRAADDPIGRTRNETPASHSGGDACLPGSRMPFDFATAVGETTEQSLLSAAGCLNSWAACYQCGFVPVSQRRSI
jgi:hypothetical protein